MEGLAAAGGVIAVVGLAGQVMQGCTSLLDVLGSITTAREDLRLLIHELRVIQDLVQSTTTSLSTGVDGCLLHDALDFCDECIGKLSQVVERYGESIQGDTANA